MPLYEEECPSCGRTNEYYIPTITEETQLCNCGNLMERRYSVPAVQIFQEYTTTNIRPDGKPVTVHSAREEKNLCKEYGVQKAG